jgi:hypothetical protein
VNAGYLITDALGNQLGSGKLEEHLTVIDVREWPSGIYLVRIADQITKICK